MGELGAGEIVAAVAEPFAHHVDERPERLGLLVIPVGAREQPHGRHLGVHVPQTVEDVDRLAQVGHPFLAPQGVPRRRRSLQEEVGALRTVRGDREGLLSECEGLHG